MGEFENLYSVFEKMPQADEELPAWLNLMVEVVTFATQAAFTNYYANYHKKLTKNVFKRCVVLPICSIVLAPAARDSTVAVEE